MKKEKQRKRSYMERVIIREILDEYVAYAKKIFTKSIATDQQETSVPPAPKAEHPTLRSPQAQKAAQVQLQVCLWSTNDKL